MLRKWIDQWFDAIVAEGAAAATVETYRYAIKPYIEFLGEETTMIGRGDVSRYLFSVSDEKSATYDLRRTAVRQLHRFLFSEDILTEDPTMGLASARKKRTLPVVLTISEVEGLIEAARDAGHARSEHGRLAEVRRLALVELLYASGLRISEALALPVETYRRSRDMVLVSGKGGRERIAPIHARAFAATDAWLDARKALPSRDNPFVFHAVRETRSALGRKQAFAEIKALAARAGVDPKRLSPHKLRHAFATHLLWNGIDIRVLQELLGHADISSTEIYTHVDISRSAAMVRDLHPMNDGIVCGDDDRR